IVADESRQQRIFDGRRRHQAAVSATQHRFRLRNGPGKPYSRTGQRLRIHQIKIVIADAGIYGKAGEKMEMVLDVHTRLSTLNAAAKINGEDIRVAASINKETFQLAVEIGRAHV